MARDDLHFRLRIPEDLKARVAESADRHKRSMTAEIIARLEASFAEGSSDNLGKPSDENTLYVLLDTNGMPISWQEALTHLHEISKGGKLRFHSQNAKILSSEHVSSTGREDDDFALFMKYRRLNKRHLSKNAAAFLADYESRIGTESTDVDDDPEGANR